MKDKMPKRKASLAERAIQAWKNAEVERKGRRINQTVKFRGEARKEFDRVFPNEEITSAKAIDPSTAKIVCGGVTFIAQEKESGIVFLVEIKCRYCGKPFLPEYANNVNDLATVGARLSVPQTCKKCLKVWEE